MSYKETERPSIKERIKKTTTSLGLVGIALLGIAVISYGPVTAVRNMSNVYSYQENLDQLNNVVIASGNQQTIDPQILQSLHQIKEWVHKRGLKTTEIETIIKEFKKNKRGESKTTEELSALYQYIGSHEPTFPLTGWAGLALDVGLLFKWASKSSDNPDLESEEPGTQET